MQVCVAFQFFASGTFQLICDQASDSRYIQDFSVGLQVIYYQFVSTYACWFKRIEVKNKFYQIAHKTGVAIS